MTNQCPERCYVERYPKRAFNRKKSCNVCGREIEVYVRLCDRCGSIQRPAGGDGLPVPSEALDTCENCGRQYLNEDKNRSDNLCPDCDAILNPRKRRLSSVARERISYAMFGSFAVASIAVALWAVFGGVSTTVMMEVLGIGGLVLIVSTASLAVMITNKRRKIRPKIPRPDLDETDYDQLP